MLRVSEREDPAFYGGIYLTTHCPYRDSYHDPRHFLHRPLAIMICDLLKIHCEPQPDCGSQTSHGGGETWDRARQCIIPRDYLTRDGKREPERGKLSLNGTVFHFG